MDRGSLLDRKAQGEAEGGGDSEGAAPEGQILRDRKLTDSLREAREAQPAIERVDENGQGIAESLQGEGVAAEEAAPAGEFLFAGQKFKTREAAEAAYNRGRQHTSALEKRHNALQSEHNQLQEVAQGWESAFAALQERGILPRGNEQATGAQRQVEQAGSQDGRQESQVQAPQDLARSFIDAVPDSDWVKVEQFAKTHGVAVAIAHVADMMDAHFRRQMTHHFAQFQNQHLAPQFQQLQPIITQYTQTHNQNRSAEFWGKEVASATTADGAPLFPELVNNPQGAREVSLFWLQLAHRFGKDFAFSDHGVRYAYQSWKNWKGQNQSAGMNAGRAAGEALARVNRAQGAAAAASVGGAGLPPSHDAPPMTEESLIKNSLKRGMGTQRVSSTGIKLGKL